MENLQKASQQRQAISVFPLHVVTHIFFLTLLYDDIMHEFIVQ